MSSYKKAVTVLVDYGRIGLEFYFLNQVFLNYGISVKSSIMLVFIAATVEELRELFYFFYFGEEIAESKRKYFLYCWRAFCHIFFVVVATVSDRIFFHKIIINKCKLFVDAYISTCETNSNHERTQFLMYTVFG